MMGVDVSETAVSSPHWLTCTEKTGAPRLLEAASLAE